MLKKFKIKKNTKYEIISYICLMVSYAIVTYILSIKNNPNKTKLFHTRKMMLIFLLSFCATIILLMILMYEYKWVYDIEWCFIMNTK